MFTSLPFLKPKKGWHERPYTRRINCREKWRGHLWQERFTSFPMDERYLLSAARYIEMNPVVAGMVILPGEYRWSSAAAHLAGKDDQPAKVMPLLDRVSDWESFLTLAGKEELALLKKHERSGRPLGEVAFVEHLEQEMGRLLRPAKRGPKPKTKETKAKVIKYTVPGIPAGCPESRGRMKNILSMVFALVILALATDSSFARASTMRCGNRLVRAGDTKGAVLARCGEPALKDFVGVDKFYDRSTSSKSTRIVEEWTYFPGEGRRMRTVIFQGNRVLDILDGQRQ